LEIIRQSREQGAGGEEDYVQVLGILLLVSSGTQVGRMGSEEGKEKKKGLMFLGHLPTK
jgi:hypothetical protein